MFSLVKEKLPALAVFNKYLKYELEEVGDSTYTPEDKTCVFCGHKDCFRVKIAEENSFYKCFSCDAYGDVIDFVSRVKNIRPREAAEIIARDFSLELPREYSVIQELFNMAAAYYNNCLVHFSVKLEILGNRDPLEYQKEVRKHSEESIKAFSVGWSDGGLIAHLIKLGYGQDSILASGLAAKPKTDKQDNKPLRDFFPRNTFIYPHYVDKNVSHFTFKDPTKRLEYQLPNKNRLNGTLFYGENLLTSTGPIYLVEGENDLISLFEAGIKENLLAVIGMVSRIQLDKLKLLCEGRDVVTVFDADEAGDKYREKLGKICSKFKTIKQVVVDNKKDIDEYLKAEYPLAPLLDKFKEIIPVNELLEEESSLKVYEKDGCYYKNKFRDGVIYPIKISNFIITLKNVYVTASDRAREVVIVREDGKRSFPFIVTSEDKVSLRLFKIRIANAIDASWYGNEEDLTYVWETVYSKRAERCVYITNTVGSCSEQSGWIFRNCFISNSGEVFHPDKEGVMWLNEDGEGIKPGTLNSNASVRDKSLDVPKLETWMSKGERQCLIKSFADNLATNLGSIGQALTMLGWSYGNTMSDEIFDRYRCYPFLFLWGKHGKGKTNIVKWLLSIFGTEEIGYTTIPQLKSGVGFSRKISWLSSLPVAIDEIRADVETVSNYGTFRAWYNRSGRVMAADKVNSIRTTEVRTNFIFSGQDMFTDPATRARCIPIQISGQNRELETSYRNIEGMLTDLSAIGFEWVHTSLSLSREIVFKELQTLHSDLLVGGCEARTAINWAIIGYFGELLGQKLFPDFDFRKYIMGEVRKDTVEQESETISVQFFDIVERLQVGAERAKINTDHIKVDSDGLVYIWFNGVIQIVLAERQENREVFSSRAIKEALREEPYFVREDRANMGIEGTQRRVIILRTVGDDVPEVLQNISHMAKY